MKTHIKGLKLFFITLILGATMSVGAQERGQYLPGFRGLNIAEQPAPGFTYANIFTYYPTDTIKDKDGKTVAGSYDLDIVADTSLLFYTSKKKFLGATYTASIAIPFLNTAVTLPRVNVNGAAGGIGDIYVEPLSLGWAFKKGKARVAYGFTAPTGVASTTSDYFGHQITVGGTYNPGKTGLWQVNMSSVWEAHHKKQNSDVTVGNNVTLEYGVGKTFVKNQGKQLVQFGIVGYSEFQLADDKGTGVTTFNRAGKDRVHAIGPEFGVILPTKKFNFFIRVLPEYAAHSRTSGITLMTGFAKTF